jgi:transcriptional antiterminator RfaH
MSRQTSRPTNRWYVASTHPHAESRALWHLTNQGFGAYLPRYLKRRTHARRTEMVSAPLFPGYLFVDMDVAATRWRAIRSTVGIRHLICRGDAPVPVPKGVVEDIRARESQDGVVPVPEPPPFARGEAVEVREGPFRDQVGFFECVNDEERIVILLSMLGRQLRIPLPVHAVRAFG